MSLTSRFMSTRRVFILQTVAGGVAAGLSAQASAQTAVAETDPQAQAVGYKADATKVDKAKQPKYAAGHQCSGCALYQGAAGSANGPCPLFGGKLVSAKGWCNAWAQKAA